MIDAVQLQHDSLGSLLPFEADHLRTLFLTRAEPASIGISPIGGYLMPCSHTDDFAVRVVCGKPANASVRVPISPGLWQTIAIQSFEQIALDQSFTLAGEGILAYDGDRTHDLTKLTTCEVTVRRDGPWIIDPTLDPQHRSASRHLEAQHRRPAQLTDHMTNFSALIEHWFEDASLQRVTPLHGGVSAEVHRVDLLLGNQTPFSLVVREHGSQHSGHPVAIEHALLSALVELGLPVPRVLFADTTGAFSRNPFLALDFIEGDTILVPEQLEPRIDQAATLLATIHQQSITSLPDLPQRVDPLPEMFEFWPGR